MEFKREARYIVVKLTDLTNAGLSQSEIDAFNTVCDKVAIARNANGKPPLQCVVVERDWPEYEPTWGAIKARMTGESRGMVLMPTELTAENGAKAALMGEFFETEDLECPDCNDEDFCETCKCTGVIKSEVPVSWTTIKDIYKKAVECCQVR